jgi:hypothetical protein
MFFSLAKPEVAVFATIYFLGYFLVKVGFETVVVLARFYIDFEFMRYGFSSFYLEFAKGL